MSPRPFVPLVLLLTIACQADAAREASKKVDDAAKATQSSFDQAKTTIDTAKQTADRSIADAQKVVVDTKDQATRLTDATVLATKKAWAGVTDTGELSKNASAWLTDTAKDSAGKVETVVAKGVQIAPVALEIALVLNAAVDDDTAVEPIYQTIEGDRTEAEIDAAIGDMPRIEVIDGVKVGFSQLSHVDASKKVDEQAYLVTWRREDKLIGFVYRTKRTIDLAMLVTETPRLVALTTKALAEQ